MASGKLVQVVIEGEDVRLVYPGLTEEDMLVAAHDSVTLRTRTACS